MRLSSGSAIKLGLLKAEQLTEPTTCYILVGDRCRNSCLFCSQNVDASMLSRIQWPRFDEDEMIKRINQSDFGRVCLQCTSTTISKVKGLTKRIKKPVSVSYNFEDISQVSQIVGIADRICIPLDVADRELYKEVKGNDYEKKIGLIRDAARLYPGRITTHLIAGLGETEQEMKRLLKEFHDMDIAVGLFAFTPIKGTAMEDRPQPDISYYRKLQAEYYKIKNNTISPKAFQTSGCSDCNRPYYNETPTGVMYNYPRELTGVEYERCKRELETDY